MFKNILKIIHIFDPRSRVQFLLLFILMLATGVLETLGIGLIMPLLSIITDPKMIETNYWLREIKHFLHIQGYPYFVITLGSIICVFYLVKNFLIGLLTYLQLRFVFSKRSAFGKRLFKSYISSPYTFHLTHNTADLLRNVGYEIPRMFNFIQSLLKICSETCVFACITILLIWVNPVIVVCSVTILGTLSAVFHKYVRGYMRNLGLKVQSSQAGVQQAVLEGFGSIKEIKLTGSESFFPKRYFLNMMDNSRANWKFSTISTIPRLFLEVVGVVTVMVIIAVLAVQGKDIKMFMPVLGLFAMATIRILPSLSQIVANMQSLHFDSSAVELIYDDLIRTSKIKYLRQEPGVLKRFEGKLSLKNVSYSYPNSEISVLNKISFDIIKGSSVAFAGSSGAGKTTLANLILGLLEPSDGHIYLDGQDIFEDLGAWQKSIGYVPQEIYLLDASIRSNIAFGLEDNEINDQKVLKAIKLARLDNFIEELPDGVNTIIGENGVRLSGGQRQRIGIARALYYDPEILVLDEATSSLDGQTEKEVSAAIELMSGKKTMIIIAHRLSTIQKCDCIYYLKNGTIAGFGTFTELMETNVDFRKMAESGIFKV